MNEPIDTSPNEIIRIIQTERLMLLKDKEVMDIKDHLKLMADMSTTALGDKRISSEDSNAVADRDMAKEISLSLMNAATDPFKRMSNPDIEPPQVTLPQFNIVEGETSTEFEQLEHVVRQ